MAKVTLTKREPTHVQSAARAFDVAGGGRHGSQTGLKPSDS
jgi:hypothetical protein